MSGLSSFWPTPENPEFLCECADLSCIQPLQLSVGEYEAIRSSPVRFVVAPDHKNPALERIVQENDRFSVVEKIGEEAATARGLAQRSEV